MTTSNWPPLPPDEALARALFLDFTAPDAPAAVEGHRYWEALRVTDPESYRRRVEAAGRALKASQTSPDLLRWCRWPGCVEHFDATKGPRQRGWMWRGTGYWLLCPRHDSENHHPDTRIQHDAISQLIGTCSCGAESPVKPSNHGGAMAWWADHVRQVEASARPYRVISIDAECDSLGGQAFCVGMTLSTATGEVAALTYRCPPARPVNDWVRENALPAIADVPLTHDSYSDMVENIAHAWESWDRTPADTIGHIVWPVEARLLLDVFPGDRASDGPYPLIDIAETLRSRGFNAHDVDGYLMRQGIAVPDGSPHHPLYDARAAERAFFHLITDGRRP